MDVGFIICRNTRHQGTSKSRRRLGHSSVSWPLLSVLSTCSLGIFLKDIEALARGSQASISLRFIHHIAVGE